MAVNSQVSTEHRQIPNLEFADRVWKIPIIQTAWSYSSSAYNKIKESNGMFNWALSTTEQTVQKALEQALPIINKLETPIHLADQTLCKGLDTLENKLPQINSTPCQIYNEAKEKVNQAIQPTVEDLTNKLNTAKDVSVGKATEIKDFSWNKVNEILSTQYGHAALSGIENTTTLAERLLDYYFPAAQGEPEDDTPISENDKLLYTLKTIGRLSNKVARRVYRSVSSNLQTLKKEDVQEYVASLVAVLHLTQYLKYVNGKIQTVTETAENKQSTSDKNKNQ